MVSTETEIRAFIQFFFPQNPIADIGGGGPRGAESSSLSFKAVTLKQNKKKDTAWFSRQIISRYLFDCCKFAKS